jgi:hypothetical protein
VQGYQDDGVVDVIGDPASEEEVKELFVGE